MLNMEIGRIKETFAQAEKRCRYFGTKRDETGISFADDYYERTSSARVIDQIRIPGLIIHSSDDPFIRVLPKTSEKLLTNPAFGIPKPSVAATAPSWPNPNGYDGR